MVGVALSALVIRWPILVIPAAIVGPMLVAQKYGLSLVELLILVSTLGHCIGLWLPHSSHGRFATDDFHFTLWKFANTAGFIAIGGTLFGVLMGWKRRRRSVKAAASALRDHETAKSGLVPGDRDAVA
jgi:hypothetical protein